MAVCQQRVIAQLFGLAVCPPRRSATASWLRWGRRRRAIRLVLGARPHVLQDLAVSARCGEQGLSDPGFTHVPAETSLHLMC